LLHLVGYFVVLVTHGRKNIKFMEKQLFLKAGVGQTAKRKSPSFMKLWISLPCRSLQSEPSLDHLGHKHKRERAWSWVGSSKYYDSTAV